MTQDALRYFQLKFSVRMNANLLLSLSLVRFIHLDLLRLFSLDFLITYSFALAFSEPSAIRTQARKIRFNFIPISANFNDPQYRSQ